jgi:hypothetical protein
LFAVKRCSVALKAARAIFTRRQRRGAEQAGGPDGVSGVGAADPTYSVELRPYFFEGKDLKEPDPLYPQVEAVADMHLSVFAFNLEYRLVFPDDWRRPEEYKGYIRSRLAQSPVMRRRLEQKAEWFSPYLQEVLK